MATGIDLGKYKLGWHDNTSEYVNTPKKGSGAGDFHGHSGGHSPPQRVGTMTFAMSQ